MFMGGLSALIMVMPGRMCRLYIKYPFRNPETSLISISDGGWQPASIKGQPSKTG
jgi:hypothetical protein